MINAAVSWNKPEVVRSKGVFFPGVAGHGEAKYFSNIISLFFNRNHKFK